MQDASYPQQRDYHYMQGWAEQIQHQEGLQKYALLNNSKQHTKAIPLHRIALHDGAFRCRINFILESNCDLRQSKLE